MHMNKNYRSGARYVWGGGILLFLLIMSHSFLSAQVKVVPTFLFMKEGQRSISFNVFNPAGGEVECWIEIKYGYATMDDTGRPAVIYDSLSEGRLDASPWIKAWPKRFTMDVGESQLIRLTVTPPSTVPEGEYWARILVKTKLSRPLVLEGANKATRANIIQVISIDIPFHYRVGRLDAGVDILNPEITTIQGGRQRFSTDVRHTGNASFWGLFDLRFLDKTNNTLVVESKKHFVAYKDFKYTLGLDSLNIPPGNYTVQAIVNTKRPDILPSLILPFGSVVKTFDYVKQ